ncbi:hypothetical protein D5086_023322 [Populus alba]|uniref:Uncharacterized protein n=2 Tax=Populus alba TaxID=43335 RepID=A0A4U5QSL9_POPAL|nr:hypothetical protein D5086_0000063080 [Populus alba]
MSLRRKTNDLMDIGLMQIEDDEGSQLSDQEVLDNIVGLVIASTWAIYYLAKYPIVLAKLREENTAPCKNKKGDFITQVKIDVAKLKYTNKLSLYILQAGGGRNYKNGQLAIIAAFVFRMATREVEYKGYKIPKIWKVIIWARYFHTNPENFEDPTYPDRWNEPARPGTHQVFGNGSRICPGNMLARLQLALFLHHLSVGYKWELLDPDADMNYLSHQMPVDGVEIVFDKI